jgi:hypothetical protein
MNKEGGTLDRHVYVCDIYYVKVTVLPQSEVLKTEGMVTTKIKFILLGGGRACDYSREFVF